MVFKKRFEHRLVFQRQELLSDDGPRRVIGIGPDLRRCPVLLLITRPKKLFKQ
jgi:hypothetical protein